MTTCPASRRLPRAYLLPAALIVLSTAACSPSGVPAVRLVEFTPLGEIDRYTNITMTFSGAVVTADTMLVPGTEMPVAFNPPIDGRFRWISPTQLRFMPIEPLLPSAEYTARLEKEWFARQGLTLAGRQTFEFHTPPLRLVGAHHRITRAEDAPGQVIIHLILEFNEAVEPGEALSRISLAIEGPATPVPLDLRLITTVTAPVLELRTAPMTLPESSHSLRLRLATGLLPAGGIVATSDRISRELPLQATRPLVVESARSVPAAPGPELEIRFSTAVDAESARAHLTLSPELEFTLSEVGTALRLRGPFQAGESYTVTIARGLRALNGATLDREFSTRLALQDLNPSVTFRSAGRYLSRQGLRNLGLEVVNVTGYQLEIEKVYRNNLVPYLNATTRFVSSYEARTFVRSIYEEEVPLSLPRNARETVTINFDRFLEQHPAGLYRVTVRHRDRWWRTDARTLLLTEIGLLAKIGGDELSVWALSTTTLEPLAGLEVALYSKTNQLMRQGRTDQQGRAVLTGLQALLDEFEPYVVTASRGEEFSYLLFEECAIAAADFDVDGRPYLTAGYEAYLYTERGVYRPGETAHLVSIVRGPGATLPPTFPLRLRLLRPDGRLLYEQQARTSEQGMAGFDLPIPVYAPTGRWVAELYGAGREPIGRRAFLIEEFMPDRMKVVVETDRERYRTGEEIEATITGTMLFGPPAAGRALEAGVIFEEAPFEPVGYGSYTFGGRETVLSRQEVRLPSARLDEQGGHRLRYQIPQTLRPDAAITATLQAEVREAGGGRAVTGYHSFRVDAYPVYVGVRREREGYGEVGGDERFRIVTLTPEGVPVAVSALQVRFWRVRWNTVLVRDSDGRYRFRSDKTRDRIETISAVTSAEGTAEVSLTPREWGQYEVEVIDLQGGAGGVVDFYASGWGYVPWAMDKPDRIELSLDRSSYKAGEHARVLIKAPFAGRLLLTVEREKVLWSRLVDLPENTADIPVRVEGEWLPGVYVTATVVRGPEGAEPSAPRRAWGTVPLQVDTGERRLQVGLEAVSETRPLRPLEVRVRVTEPGGPLATTARVTVAAVDEGILQLTGFASPDPGGFFYAKPRLGVTTYDIFAQLLAEVEQSRVHSSPSGDRMEQLRTDMLSPVRAGRVKPVALWSGILPVAGDGRVTARFDLPEFNGRLRIMAVAAAGERFGWSESAVLVREPIVLTPSLPRMAAPGDRFLVPVEVFNSTGRAATIRVRASVEGPMRWLGSTEQQIELAEGAEGQVGFEAAVDRAVGVAHIRIEAEAAGVSVRTDTEVPVRPAAPRVSRTGSGGVAAGSETVLAPPAGWVEGSGRFTLSVLPMPAIRFLGGLSDLLRYPYGCLEQITSQTFPLIYFSELARAAEPELFGTRAPEYYIGETITRLAALQLPSGVFAFWPGGTASYDWASLYTLHFLLEARRGGYPVPERVLDRALAAARQMAYGTSVTTSPPRAFSLVSTPGAEVALRSRAYAAYVLALAGRPERGAMHYLYEARLSELSFDARLLLAGAYALAGDRGTAFRLLPAFQQPITSGPESAAAFGSDVRDNALLLYLLADLSPEHASIPALVDYLSDRALAGRWGTTQENAWAFLALGRLLSVRSADAYTGTLLFDGQVVERFGTQRFTLQGSEWLGRDLRLQVEGTGTAYYYWEAQGVPIDQRFVEEDRGVRVRRHFLDLEGQPVRADSLKQGELVVVAITVTALGRPVGHLAIQELLPAGLEVENPRLESRAAIGWLPANLAPPDYLDIRDDRLLFFADRLEMGRERRFYYLARAVTAGDFILPPVSAEAMYEPSVRSTSGSGQMRIVP